MSEADDTRGGLPSLLSTLSRREANLVLDLQSSSTRKLHDFLERHEMPSPGVNGISRQFVAASRKLAKTLNARSLEHVNVAAIVIDGTEYHRRTIYWALGITVDGQKLPLGFAEGGSESAELVSGLFASLHDRGLDTRNAVWIVDAHQSSASALRQLPSAVVQRCTFHKGTRVVRRHLPADQREELGSRFYRRLGRAWAEDDPRKAMRRIRRIAAWLARLGHGRAAESLLADVDMSLALHRLGVPRALRRHLRSTNAIESTHGVIEEYRAKPDNWQPPPSDMRARFFAAGIACAERSWRRIGMRRALEQMQLSIALARHPTVALSFGSRRTALAVWGVRVRGEQAPAQIAQARAALGEVLRWADRNGRQVELSDDALARLGDAAEELHGWLREEGFAERTREGSQRAVLVREPLAWAERRAREAAEAREAEAAEAPEREAEVEADAAQEASAPAAAQQALPTHVGEELRVAVAETALEQAPSMVERTDAELEALAGELETAHARLGEVEPAVQAWWQAHGLGGAREIALERVAMARGERPWRHPLAGARRAVLGEARAQSLLGESAYQGALIEGVDDAQLRTLGERVGTPLAQLDGAVARVEEAGRATAAARELERRRQLAQAQARAAAGADAQTAPDATRDAAALAPLDRWSSALGPRRTALLRAQADALAPGLAALDDRELGELRRTVGDPWRRLDAASARRTRALEERDREGALRERARTLRELVGWERMAEGGRNRHMRAAAAERVASLREAARQAWGRLRGIESEAAAERAREGSLDRFVAEHPEAALDHALEVERVRRQERVAEQAQAVEEPAAEQEAAAEAGAEAGM